MERTYLELKAEAENLLRQAEEARQREVVAVIAEIKEKIDQYGIAAADLGFAESDNSTLKKGSSKSVAELVSSKDPVPPKYRGPNGEEWAGRGRQPQWLTKEIEEGKNREDFAIR